jgi:nucleoside-diphosphate-sugar epimerase
VSRVLVTGATGFVGRHLLAPLTEAGHEVHAVSTRPPTGEAGVVWHRSDLLAGAGVVDEVAPEVLIHLAWYVEPGRFWTAPENVYWVEATLALLRAFAATGGRRAVLAGTSAEYDWAGRYERCHEERTPRRPATLYGAAKDGLHQIAAAYAERMGFALAWGRIFFVYGPGEPGGRLVPSVGRAVLAGERVPTTAGEQVRDFMYVEDVARAFAAVADSDVTGPVNIASGEPLTVLEMVQSIAAAAGRPDLPQPGALPAREGDPSRLVADVGRLQDEVGFTPHTGVEEGVARTLDWLRASQQ